MKKRIALGIVLAVLVLVALESIARLVERIDPPDVLAVPPKEEGVFRVFVYGGSTAYGTPVPDFGFVAQMEYWLREWYPRRALEIHSFARPARASATVRATVEETLRHDPDLLIVLTGHNEFLSRGIEGRGARLARRLATTRMAARGWTRLRTRFAPASSKDVMARRFEPFDRDSPLFVRKVEAFESNLRRIAELARDEATPLLLMTAPSNLLDWAPVHEGIAGDGPVRQHGAWRDEVELLLAQDRSEDALAWIGERRREHPRDPMLLYLHGRAHVAAGDPERGAILLVEAKDADLLPLRALTRFNDLVRELGRADHVTLVDAEAILRRRAPHGLVGFELIVDNCHPTPLGNAILARELCSVLAREGWLTPRAPGEADREGDGDGDGEGGEERSVEGDLEQFLSHAPLHKDRRTLEREYLLHNGKYCMTMPFHDRRASRMYLERALGAYEQDWEIWANLATLSLFDGRRDEARRQLRRATELRGRPLDPGEQSLVPYLHEALTRSGVRLAEL